MSVQEVSGIRGRWENLSQKQKTAVVAGGVATAALIGTTVAAGIKGKHIAADNFSKLTEEQKAAANLGEGVKGCYIDADGKITKSGILSNIKAGYKHGWEAFKGIFKKEENKEAEKTEATSTEKAETTSAEKAEEAPAEGAGAEKGESKASSTQDTLNKTLEDAKANEAKIQDQINAKTAEIDEIKAKAQEVETLGKDLETKKTELAALTDEAQKADKQKEIEELENKIAEYGDLEKQGQEAEAEIAKLNEELENAKKATADAQEAVDKVETNAEKAENTEDAEKAEKADEGTDDVPENNDAPEADAE